MRVVRISSIIECGLILWLGAANKVPTAVPPWARHVYKIRTYLEALCSQ